MWKLSGTREEMFAQIEKNSSESEVRIMVKPSKSVFFHLLQKTRVSRIFMTRGIYSTVPAKVLSALKDSGVSVEIVERRVGSPAKFAVEKKLEALRMMKEGKTAPEISGKLGVSAASIYAWRRRLYKKQVSVPDST